MPPPILHSLPQSPPGRVVEYVAKELGLDLDYRNFDFYGGEFTTPVFTAKSPIRTIPALDDNGTYIFDSHAIVMYLIQKYGKNDSLYPNDHVKRAKVNAVLFFETQFLFARTRSALEPVFYERKGYTYKSLVEKLGDSLDRFERLLVCGGTNYVAGDSLTIADFSCITSLGLVELMYTFDPAKYPTIDAWRKRMYAKYPHIEEREKQALIDLNKRKDEAWPDRKLL